MGIAITHNKVSSIPDGVVPGEVQPSDWNRPHNVVLSGALKAVDEVAPPAGVKRLMAFTGPAQGLLIAISDYVAGLLASDNSSAMREALGIDLDGFATHSAVDAAIAAAIADLIASAPGALDTLNELAAALGNDPDFAATITNALAGKVSTSRTISAAGLATGGGDLTANRTITVPVASQAEAEAGEANDKAMTPLRTAQAIAALASGGVPASRTISAEGLATGGGDLSADRTITVPVASQAEAEAGEANDKAMTPLRTAQAIAAFGGGFPSGTKMLFQQTAAPSGWTKDTTHNDKALRVVSGSASSGGSVAFSTVFARTATDNHTLTVSEMPSHSHSRPMAASSSQYDLTAGGSGPFLRGDGSGAPNTGSAGGGGAHAHNIDLRVQYVDLIIATKD